MTPQSTGLSFYTHNKVMGSSLPFDWNTKSVGNISTLQLDLFVVWILLDLPIGKRAIGTKWVFKNKKDERGIVIRNKARLVAHGHRQEEGYRFLTIQTKFTRWSGLYGLHHAPEHGFGNLGYYRDGLNGLSSNSGLSKCFATIGTALTETPTIYVSLINQFWCTASVRTLDNREIELIATVDGQEKYITKASVMRHLKFADVDGISSLLTTKIFEQLALMGRWSQVPLYHGGSPVQARLERLSNLPNKPPLGEGNTSRSVEGSMQLLELMEICTKLLDKVIALEDELRSTKDVYNKSLITLTKRVKKLENKLKLKRRSTIVNSSEDEEASLDIEDPSKQGRMIEDIIKIECNLVKSSKEREAHEKTKLEGRSVVDVLVLKDKGKAIMQESEPPKKIKKRVQVQMSVDEELAKKGGYKHSHFKGMKYEEIRPIFERVWDQNQAIVPKDSEIEKEVMKRSCFIQKQSTEEEKEKKKDEESSKQVEEETVQKEDVIPEQVMKESSRKAEGKLKRKASKPREDKDKRQKKRDDPE
ncbi:putative ribonuclease H-like domain-containing protein [Tanacetum coccineum]